MEAVDAQQRDVIPHVADLFPQHDFMKSAFMMPDSGSVYLYW